MSAATSLTVRVPLAIKARGGRKVIVSPDGMAKSLNGRQVRTTNDPALTKALARAFRWQRMLSDGRYASIREIARAEKIDRGYVGSMVRLTLLAPDILETALAGSDAGAALPRLLQPFPVAWEDQRAVFSDSSIGNILLVPTVCGEVRSGSPWVFVSRTSSSYKHSRQSWSANIGSRR